MSRWKFVCCRDRKWPQPQMKSINFEWVFSLFFFFLFRIDVAVAVAAAIRLCLIHLARNDFYLSHCLIIVMKSFYSLNVYANWFCFFFFMCASPMREAMASSMLMNIPCSYHWKWWQFWSCLGPIHTFAS